MELYELTRKYVKELYQDNENKYELRSEDGRLIELVPVTALSAVLLAAKELKYTGYVYFSEKIGGIQNFHLPIDFVDGVAYLGKYSWGWQRRIPARNFVSSIKIAS